MALRLDGYIRVSRVGGREGEGYISPEVQRDSISAYAAELGGTITAWHDDQDYSGGNTERPGFQTMLDRLERGETDGIVVMSIDRFARSTADGSKVIREIVNRDQVFASCHERIDPRTDEGRYMLRSFLSNAELFLDQTKTRWKTAKGRAIQRGAHIGPTPTGYLKVEPLPSKPTHISPADSAAMGGPTGPGVLTPRPIYGPAISELFKRAATRRYGDSELARWLSQEARREGGAHWTGTEIRRFLKNTVYLGQVRHGSLVNLASHEPLTDEKTFKRCQREPGERKTAPSPFLLRGLLRCAGCRYAMGGATNGGRDGRIAIYRCYRSPLGCPAPSLISARLIEEYLTEIVAERQEGLLLGQAADDAEATAAIEAFDQAAAEVDAFAADLEARRLLGETGWQEALRLRVADRDGKQPAKDAAVAALASRELAQRSTADLDRQGLRDLLTGMIRYVFIRRGRGVPPAERSLIVWADDPTPIDIPGRHNKTVFESVGW